MITLLQLRNRHAAEERALILRALEESGWQQTAAAKTIGASRRFIDRAINRHGLGAEYAKRNQGRGRPRIKISDT